MYVTRRHETFTTLLFAGAAVFISLSSVIFLRNYKAQTQMVAAVPIVEITPEPDITNTPTVTTSSQTSSDGAKQLTLYVTEHKDTSKTYELTATQSIFKKTLTEGNSISIPFNTWSPDNKYFFVEEHDGNNTQVFVFQGSGDPFSDGKKYLDLTDAYIKRGFTNQFQEATGWASENLIIINSTTQDGAKGPSYWFEVPSKALIQLSTQF